MYHRFRVIAVVPCLNEAQKICQVITRLKLISLLDEIVVVDDASSDSSPQVITDLGATLLKHSHPKGVGAALRTGFEYASSRCDFIVVLAGNNKDEPKEIERLLFPLAFEGQDFVQGSRFMPGGRYGGEMPLYRKWATRIHPILFSLVTGRRVTESTNGFRAFRSELLNDKRINLNQAWLNQYELEPYLYFKAIRLGYRTCEVPVTKIYPPKKMGYTKMKPLIGWWSILRPLFLLRLGLRR